MTGFETELLAFLQSFGPVDIREKKPLSFTCKGKTFRAQCIDQPMSGQHDIVIWQDLWHTQNEVIKGRIISALGLSIIIHGRETSVQKIDKPTAQSFLNDHHLQKATKSKLQLGLIHDNELTAVATFSKPCPIDRDGRQWKSIELLRFCCLPGLSVTGGLSKLIKKAIEILEPEDIMTYVDLEWSEGEGFSAIGFAWHGKTEPHEFLVDPNTLERHFVNQIDNPSSLIRICNRGSQKMILEV